MQQEYDPEASPYSFGTTPIYNTLYRMLTDRNDKTDIVMINLSVILRNVSGKTSMVDLYKKARDKFFPFKVVADKLVKETIAESKMLISDIVQMMAMKSTPLPRYVILYQTDYASHVPKDYFREPTASKVHIDLAEEQLRKLNPAGYKEYESSGIRIIEWYDYSKTVFFRMAEELLRHIKNLHHIVMVSNHPIDYHIQMYVANWTCVKSYTGQVFTKKELPENVFETPDVPFTIKTHILLGDKNDLKQALTPKCKKDLILEAERDSWKLKTPRYIDEALDRLHYIVPYII